MILILLFNFSVVAESNSPPTKPDLIGVNSGNVNKTYTFTALSTDPDEDQIKYAFSFGDNKEMVFSELLTSGTSYTVSHSWEEPGLYTVKVNVKDTQNSFSDTAEINVLINAKFCGFLGYFIDSDNDKIYDKFYSNSSEQIVDIDRIDIYLIDIDSDGNYDYRYNTTTGEIQMIASQGTEENEFVTGFDYGFWMPLIFFIIVVFVISLFFILNFKTTKIVDEEKTPTTDFSFLVNKKESKKEEPTPINKSRKDFDNVVFEKKIKVEKSNKIQDIEKYIDEL
jgi:hypothetical protein